MSPTAMAVCLAIGTISMLLASTMALVTRDIKQVWAYSTISQLGFMLMGLGAGSLPAGMFHLITHAGFKALLFLGAGVLIHHFGTNDIFEIGRQGGRRLKSATVGLVIGAGALSGLPPLSGFFSKELILGQLLELNNPIWFLAATVGAFLTAYYAFRLIFILLFPHNGIDSPPGEHPAGPYHRGSEFVMNGVLWCLITVTVVIGFWQSPLLDGLALSIGAAARAPGHHDWLPFVACMLAGVAVVLAWFEFGRRGASQIGLAERVPWMRNLFAQRWYLDRLYRFLLDTLIYRGVSRLFSANDRRVIDGAVDGLGRSMIGLGRMMARLHLGRIQYRLMAMFVGVIVLALYLGWGG